VSRAPLLVLLGWALLSVGWVFGNPPFAAPDEAAHYLRALEVGRGHVITAHEPDAAKGGTERQMEWNREVTYAVRVPPGMKPPDTGCYITDAHADAGCLDRFQPPPSATRTATVVGNYEPLPYLLPGVVMRAADTPAAALRLARLANALLTLVLLGIALGLAWSEEAGPLSLLGIVVAVTPMVVFCGSILNGSGPEIAAGITLACALLRLRRAEDGARAGLVWAAVGASGATLVLTRALGPIWLALIVLATVALTGGRHALRLVRAGGARAAAAVGAIAVAMGLNLLWEALHGPRAELSLANARAVVEDGVSEWWRASSELIGKFGYLQFRLPSIEYVLWFGAGFALIVAAIWLGSRRERRVLSTSLGVALVLPMLYWLVAIRQTGVGLQGRHVLPALVAVPLLAGDVLRAHAGELPGRLRRALVVGIPIVVATGQLSAWYWNAERSAVGTDGPLVFVGRAGWSPPLGWGPWLVAVIAGSLALAGAFLGSRRSNPGQ
jgi:hypothetical protein